jgi:MoaA/NifB/PqqE/SkfB family radical SAM enzyme
MRTPISVPPQYNYVAAFLTLECNFRCNYCINHPDYELQAPTLLSASAWANYFNRLQLPEDLPISLQGGEPSTHPEFFQLLAGINEDKHIDLLTNLSFDVERLAREIPAKRFQRKAPYAAIRVTYHPGQSNLEETLDKLAFLQDRGYPVGLYSIRVPGHEKLIARVSEKVKQLGIDYRTKEYLGKSKGQVWGTYHYEGGVFSKDLKKVQCRTSELLIAPDGRVYRCHRDLYLKEHPIGSIAGERPFEPTYSFRSCDRFGECNPCDLKRKTNRFQQEGHASVEIRFETKEAEAF